MRNWGQKGGTNQTKKKLMEMTDNAKQKTINKKGGTLKPIEGEVPLRKGGKELQ